MSVCVCCSPISSAFRLFFSYGLQQVTVVVVVVVVVSSSSNGSLEVAVAAAAAAVFYDFGEGFCCFCKVGSPS